MHTARIIRILGEVKQAILLNTPRKATLRFSFHLVESFDLYCFNLEVMDLVGFLDLILKKRLTPI